MKARAGKKGETEDAGGKKWKVAKAEKEDAIEPEKLTDAAASSRRARKAQDLHEEKSKPKEEPEEVGKEVRKRKRESTQESTKATLEKKKDVKTETRASNKGAAKPEDKEEKDGKGKEPSKCGSRKCDDAFRRIPRKQRHVRRKQGRAERVQLPSCKESSIEERLHNGGHKPVDCCAKCCSWGGRGEASSVRSLPVQQ